MSSAPDSPDLASEPFGRQFRASMRRIHLFQKAHLMRAHYFALRAARKPHVAMRELATSHEVLSPEETLAYVAPRMQPGHLERVQSGFEGEPAANVIARLTRNEQTHAATEAFTVENVALIGPKLYAGPSCYDLDKGRMPRPAEMEELDHVVLAATYAGSHWFGHCIHDDLPITLLAQELGFAVAQAREPYRDEPAYRAAFGVPVPHIAAGFLARRCTFLVDYSQNASKRARYARMQAQLPRTGPATRVYIQRAGGDARSLREEPALIEQLDKRGFTILNNGRDSADRMVEVCTRASQVVCVDGSHAAPAMLLAPAGSEFFDICPPQRVTDTMVNIAQAAGMRSALYVGTQGAPDGTFSVELDDLLGFLDAFRP